MANSEKLFRIKEFLDSAASDARREANRDDMSSANWIYAKGVSFAYARALEVVQSIIAEN